MEQKLSGHIEFGIQDSQSVNTSLGSDLVGSASLELFTVETPSTIDVHVIEFNLEDNLFASATLVRLWKSFDDLASLVTNVEFASTLVLTVKNNGVVAGIIVADIRDDQAVFLARLNDLVFSRVLDLLLAAEPFW
jgi:hypothetical protein